MNAESLTIDESRDGGESGSAESRTPETGPKAPSPKAVLEASRRESARERNIIRPVLAGFGAWLVSIGPTLSAATSSFWTRLFALVSLASLVGAYFTDRKGLRRATELLLYWSFPILSGVTLATLGYVPGRPDAAAGFLGCLAWGFFAFAGASGTLSTSVAKDSYPSERRFRWEWVLLTMTGLATLSLQILGWGYATSERALLVRVLGASLGIAVVGATTNYLLHRKETREAASEKTRARALLTVIVMLLFVTTLGTVAMLLR